MMTELPVELFINSHSTALEVKAYILKGRVFATLPNKELYSVFEQQPRPPSVPFLFLPH